MILAASYAGVGLVMPACICPTACPIPFPAWCAIFIRRDIPRRTADAAWNFGCSQCPGSVPFHGPRMS